VKRFPALVVSGFLGSGKTTLVRRLLTAAQAEGQRVAIISNEFGALGVDQALLGGGGDMVELAGGCVCCALNDELYNTILALREKIDPDRLIIETSGLAVAADVQITFWQPPIRDWVSEEAVVTVVNAEQLLEGRDLAGIFEEQIQTADLIILNQVDRVPAERLTELETELRRRGAEGPVVRALRAEIDLRLLQMDSAHSPELDHDHDHQAHHSHEGWQSEVWDCPGEVDPEVLVARLRQTGAARVKGFVRGPEGPVVIQGVGRRIEWQPWLGEAPLGRIVLIRRP
jgi:cobalamin biosynthesis protein CobW